MKLFKFVSICFALILTLTAVGQVTRPGGGGKYKTYQTGAQAIQDIKNVLGADIFKVNIRELEKRLAEAVEKQVKKCLKDSRPVKNLEDFVEVVKGELLLKKIKDSLMNKEPLWTCPEAPVASSYEEAKSESIDCIVNDEVRLLSALILVDDSLPDHMRAKYKADDQYIKDMTDFLKLQANMEDGILREIQIEQRNSQASMKEN